MAESIQLGNESGCLNADDVVGRAARGVGAQTWYPLGARAVLGPVQCGTPQDLMIPDGFNIYWFVDHRDHVMYLLNRVCSMSTFATAA